MRLFPALQLATVAFAVAACGDGAPPAREATPAAVTPAVNAPPEHYESTAGKFVVDFPATWHDAYRVVERADTLAGSRHAVEFVFKPDPAWKVQPRPLVVVRIFPKAAWEKITKRPGDPMALKVAERGDDVFVYSVPGSNPYRPGTPAALRFDELMLGVMPGLKLTPR